MRALGEVLGLLAVAVALVVALVAGPAEGLVLTKCEMKAELEAMLPDMDDDGDGMAGRFNMEDILAKIVCKIEFTTQFNTSHVTVLDASKPSFPGRRPWPPRSGDDDGGEGSASVGEEEPASERDDKPERPVRTPWRRPFGRPWTPPRRGKRAAMMGRFRPTGGRPWGGRPRPAEESEEEPEEVEEEVEEDASTWTLYGIFQLADRVVCETDGDTPSLNVCQMPCSDLIDDDISDDIDCVKELKRTHEKMKLDPEQKFMALAMRAKMMAMMFPQQCRSAVAADYFAECTD